MPFDRIQYKANVQGGTFINNQNSKTCDPCRFWECLTLHGEWNLIILSMNLSCFSSVLNWKLTIYNCINVWDTR